VTVAGLSTNSASVQIWGGSANPLVNPSPDIDWNYTITISNPTVSSATVTINGSHDCFPAHEVYVGRQQIHGFTPTVNVTQLTSCLLGAFPVSVNQTYQLNMYEATRP
jgi:hypothetical protein